MCGVRWKSLFGVIDLSTMMIDLSTSQQTPTYQWKINNIDIARMTSLIASRMYAVETLARALSVIHDDAPIYVPTCINDASNGKTIHFTEKRKQMSF